PASVLWGPEGVQLYNGAYAALLGPLHPRALGQAFREGWPEAWEALSAHVERVLVTGGPVRLEDCPLPLHRDGVREEAYATLSLSRIEDDRGRAGGVLLVAVETTPRVLSERRLRTLHDLAAREAQAETTHGACAAAARALAGSDADVPFALIYA